MIIKANTSDDITLTNIALDSKAFWGYSKDLIESWTLDLTVSSIMISEMIVYKFISEDKVIGFYILNQPEDKIIELEFLFVLQDFIGKGVGNQLIEHAFNQAKQLNCSKMKLVADPNAVPFYKSKGFLEIDKIESSIFNRFLPLMQKDLEK